LTGYHAIDILISDLCHVYT